MSAPDGGNYRPGVRPGASRAFALTQLAARVRSGAFTLDGAIKVDPKLFRKHIAVTAAPVALDIGANRASDRLFLHVVLANA